MTAGFRSGFAALVGRPNAGKSTLLNVILGTKVSIVSDKPQTTRHRVLGVLHRSDAQVVFVDTPGMHKPVTALGHRLNDEARGALDADVVCLVIDATAPVGRGDEYIAAEVAGSPIVVVTKIDAAGPAAVLAQLDAARRFDGADYYAVSGRTGEGVEALVGGIVERLPEGPPWYPDGVVTDTPEAARVAELVREQLFLRTREELPYSIATRVVEWNGRYVRCEILVERPSQVGMVVGRKGRLIKEVGSAVRRQLPEGTYLDLHVRVEKDWQRRPAMVDRLLDPDPGDGG